ncbi:hypothetical protein Tco_1398143, partial [Tanacetum coccineum]
SWRWETDLSIFAGCHLETSHCDGRLEERFCSDECEEQHRFTRRYLSYGKDARQEGNSTEV